MSRYCFGAVGALAARIERIELRDAQGHRMFEEASWFEGMA
jgi:hypothetical protein